MSYKPTDPYKEPFFILMVIMLVLDVLCLIWVVRRDQRESIERAARIEQFQTEWVTYELEELECR